MRHVGLQGHCDCLLTHDEHGRDGVLLRIETRQCVPPSERLHFERYFARKLRELGALGSAGGWALQLVIRDRNEPAPDAARPHRHVSSGRIASILRAFNGHTGARAQDQVLELRESVRQRLSARREERRDSDYAPLSSPALTDLGALAEH